MKDLSKKYYRISEVAEILGVPASTLRFWEQKFTIIKPRRTGGSVRTYTAEDVEKLRMIHFLVKEKGLKIEAAEKQIKTHSDGVSRRYEAIARLRKVRDDLANILGSLNAMK